ncbi:Response regulator receiver domain-containing protein [Pseudomonas linyingensis]|uniref:Response regulator receiver domain-containing protein n=1 Tax=Pseudomonas linyingensis TaxID=915471 RepID=A0A1H7C108_9PSED|nr:response regulator [Pseudomonas linyingensis]SEJ80662.1 Response regulator receiver domain-containing protein [Pseudomonas linyingensis]
MTANKKLPVTIMVATDDKADATIIQNQLQLEFEHLIMALDEDSRIDTFDEQLPDVLVLAFKSLKRSEEFYLELYRQSAKIHLQPHRTVVLCSKQGVHDAYELCRREVFDDYIMFWPMTHDAPRLRMSVHNALREQRALKRTAPALGEFAQQAQRIAELEELLEQHVAEGSLHLATVDRAVNKAEQDIGSAFDHLHHRAGSYAHNDPQALHHLQEEIVRLKQAALHQPFQNVSTAMQPVHQWAAQLQHDYSPHIESVRALGAQAREVRPRILLVDDDEFVHKIVAHQLDARDYDLSIARDATEALRMLRNNAPDLVLLDIVMPGVNGLEALRRFRLMPSLEKTPFIMLTGKSEGAVVVESLKSGANDFIAKPFDRATLLAKIGRLL